MMLVQEGSLMINKDQVQAANYITEFQIFLAPTEVEDSNKMINGLQINSDSNQGNALAGGDARIRLEENQTSKETLVVHNDQGSHTDGWD